MKKTARYYNDKLCGQVCLFKTKNFSRDELKSIHVRKYIRQLNRSASYLSGVYGVKVPDITRCAMHTGIKNLWLFEHAIGRIKSCRQIVYESGNTSLLGWFETAHFDLASSEGGDFSGVFLESDILQCAGFAAALGVQKSVVYQLAIASGLLKAEELPGHDNLFLFNLISRFCDWLDDRVRYALQIAKMAKDQKAGVHFGPVKTWRDVLAAQKEKKHLFSDKKKWLQKSNL